MYLSSDFPPCPCLALKSPITTRFELIMELFSLIVIASRSGGSNLHGRILSPEEKHINSRRAKVTGNDSRKTLPAHNKPDSPKFLTPCLVLNRTVFPSSRLCRALFGVFHTPSMVQPEIFNNPSPSGCRAAAETGPKGAQSNGADGFSDLVS